MAGIHDAEILLTLKQSPYYTEFYGSASKARYGIALNELASKSGYDQQTNLSKTQWRDTLAEIAEVRAMTGATMSSGAVASHQLMANHSLRIYASVRQNWTKQWILIRDNSQISSR